VTTEDQLLALPSDRKSRGWSDASYGDRPQPEAMDDRLGEVRIGWGIWQHVQHKHDVALALRAGERIEITDVAGRTCDRAWSGEMI